MERVNNGTLFGANRNGFQHKRPLFYSTSPSKNSANLLRTELIEHFYREAPEAIFFSNLLFFKKRESEGQSERDRVRETESE